MRVLLLTQTIMDRGGTYARSFTMARGLASLGHQVTLLAASKKRRPYGRAHDVDGVRVIEMPGLLGARTRHGGFGPLDLLQRCLYVARHEYDLVHGIDHRPTVSIPAALFSRLRHKPFVADWCDLWGPEGLGGLRSTAERAVLSPFDGRLERWMAAHATAVTVVSAELRRRAHELGRRPDRVLLLPPAANDDLIRPLPVEDARRSRSIPPDRQILVFSGYTRVGSTLLGEAFSRVVQRVPSVLLVLVGGRQPDFDRIVDGRGLRDRVLYLGVRSYADLSGILACGDVMLLPYPDHPVNRAGFANKLGDYLAAGRPIVANRTGDLGAVVEQNHVGVTTADDPDAYADGICRLLETPGLRAEMGFAARRLAETSFSFRARARELDAFYARLA